MTKPGELILSEYSMLCERVNLVVAQRRTVEERVFLAVSAFYAWTFSQASSLGEILFQMSLLFPGLILVVGFARWFGLQFQIVLIKGRLLEIETQFSQNQQGWETYVSKRRKQNPIVGWGHAISEVLAWLVFILVCAAIAYFLWDKYDLISKD
jgi:hypothetical protein